MGPEVTFHSTRHSAITKDGKRIWIVRLTNYEDGWSYEYIYNSTIYSKQPDDDKIIKQKMDDKQYTLQLVGGSRA